MMGLTKTDWRAIARRIQRGKCTPIFGDRLHIHMLPRYDGLSSAWAKEINYPLGEDYTITRLAQYLSVSIGNNSAKEEFLSFIKAYTIAQKSGHTAAQVIDKFGPRLLNIPLTKIVAQMGLLKSDRPENDPLNILAGLPIPIYITTSYYNFIESALQRLQKKPRTDSCSWMDNQREQKGGKSSNSLPVFYKLMLQYFNVSELEEVCFDLGIDYETLVGSGKGDKTRELILYLNRHNRIPDLLELCKHYRPQLSWPEISGAMHMMEGQLTVPSSFFKQNPDYRPTSREPLIYHLFGLETKPNSIVLTEDDYLDFLMRISQEKRLIPPVVTQSLEDSSLLLLGYSINDWEFRTLFRGLIASRRGSRRDISVSIQMEADQYTPEAQQYLEHYFREVDFKMYWGTPQDFLINVLNYVA